MKRKSKQSAKKQTTKKQTDKKTAAAPAITFAPVVPVTPAPAQPAAASSPFANSKGNPDCLGVDIAKAQLVADIPGRGIVKFPNSTKGIQQLIAACANLTQPHVICEATGAYERALVASLHAARIAVSVVVPARARHFAKGNAKHAKTDPLDARLLSRLGRESECEFHEPPPDYVTHLRDLIDTRRMIKNRQTQVTGMLENATPRLREELKGEETRLEKRLAKIDDEIEEHIKNTPSLKADDARLQKITGVGIVGSATFLAYVPEARRLSAKRICSLVGLAPYPEDSGKRRHRGHIHGGRKPIRDVLYMCARTAIDHNKILGAFYDHLLSKKKLEGVAHTAVMRKLLLLMHRMLTKPDFELA